MNPDPSLANPAMPDTPSPADRRVAKRYQPAFGTVCRFPCDGSGPLTLGLVWNISQTGVSMLMSSPPQPGTMVRAELTLETGEQTLPVEFRVVHCRAVRTGDYLLGGHFNKPLELEEMRPFLTPQAWPITTNPFAS